jgi:hypothetical protein
MDGHPKYNRHGPHLCSAVSCWYRSSWEENPRWHGPQTWWLRELRRCCSIADTHASCCRILGSYKRAVPMWRCCERLVLVLTSRQFGLQTAGLGSNVALIRPCKRSYRRSRLGSERMTDVETRDLGRREAMKRQHVHLPLLPKLSISMVRILLSLSMQRVRMRRLG